MDKHVEDLLLPFLRNELGPAERRDVEAHTARCAECRRALLDFDRLATDLGRWAPPAPLIHWGAYGAELRDKLERRGRRLEGGWWRLRPVPVALATGLVALLIYIGAPEFGRRGGPGDEDQGPVDNAMLASRLDLISRLDLVQRLDLLEDFDVIRRLDNLERSREG